MFHLNQRTTMTTNRRGFLGTSLAAGAAGLVGVAGPQQAASAGEKKEAVIKPGQVILFQGDSITDAGRSRETANQPNQHSTLGNGYAWLAASQLLVDYPKDSLTIYNRGISGNKIPDLAARWQEDCLDLKPDVLSILIGVNDYAHARRGAYDGSLESYESGYRALLKRTVDALPNVKLIIAEPFVLNCGAVDDSWFPELAKFRDVAKKIAEEFKASFVAYQTAFDRAVEFSAPAVWGPDGVHPSPDGAALMAHTWRNALA